VARRLTLLASSRGMVDDGANAGGRGMASPSDNGRYK
jgi:hypothetical protein